ncbi:hypothetical protein [Streptomyces sp. Inha503]|uniref:hypothetical protein n=1 Tax=Streptomyces sp. Inha503 TaxID=3383314 RepID=UPI0039A2F67B
MARTPLDLDDLVEHWTLLKDEQGLVSGKRDATRLGFAVLLKFYTQYGRFPRGRFEVNTLMLQDILGEPEWADLLTPADRRGLTPLFWSHVRPYGDVNLDMDTRLNLTAATFPRPRAADSEPARSAVENV